MSVKVLIVDDSALMRKKIAELIAKQGYEIKFAKNGVEAVALNSSFQPDVITLDINMPEMDGLTALAEIMVSRPVPVIMLSSLTEKGALSTFEAMALGAFDYIPKPDGTISLSIENVESELIGKIQAALNSRLARENRAAKKKDVPETVKPEVVIDEPIVQPETTNGETANGADLQGIVLIGVSTGGPKTLEGILQEIPADFPYPIVIAQHMPASFTGPFAERINLVAPLNVFEVAKPCLVEKGNVYIGKGGGDIVFTTRVGRLYVMPKPESSQFLWHPSVELLGLSALEHCNAENIIGVMLTGMGNDGAESFALIRKQGGKTIAESEETAIVFGMPKELIALGGATKVLPATAVARQLISWATRMGDRHAISEARAN